MISLGKEIRIGRNQRGLTLNEAARKVGISPMTLQRIETGKSSPSLVLLSEIARVLNKSVYTFIREKRGQKSFVHIKKRDQISMATPIMKFRIIGPKKVIGRDTIVTYGVVNKGRSIDPHTNSGKEFTYILEGRCQFKQDNKVVSLEAGDSIFHNARIEHSIVATEKFIFFSIYMKDKG